MPSTRSSLSQTRSRASKVQRLPLKKRKVSTKRLSMPKTDLSTMGNIIDRKNGNPNPAELKDAPTTDVAQSSTSTQASDTVENALDRAHDDDSEVETSTEQSQKFVAGQQTACYLVPGYFHKTTVMYTSEEHHMYTKNKYNDKLDVCYWKCQDCAARIRTTGNPKNLVLNQRTVCWFTDSYKGHSGHAAEVIKSRKNSKLETVKDGVVAAVPSTSSKTSVGREVFDRLISPEE